MSASHALRNRRTALERQWSEWRTGLGPADLRAEVLASWTRSVATVDPGREAAPVGLAGDVSARWSASPLHEPVTELADELVTIADDAGFIAAVTDEAGTILWTCGGRVMRRRAEQVNFAPGGSWNEPAMGTNALSLALRTGRAHSVFSAEHLVHALHGWVCYCAPIHGPNGRLLGVLDLSSTWDRSHPLAMSTVRTLVSTIEGRLHERVDAVEAPAPTLRLACLGQAVASVGTEVLALRPRGLEILTLLALHPDGLTPDRLRHALFGDRPVAPATLKAQVSHVRAALGGALATRRYALTGPISCDATDVLGALARRDVEGAVRAYGGPLLPESDAPGVRVWREHIAVAVRAAVLGSPVPEHALRFGERHPFDVDVHQHACRLLPGHDPRRGLALARLRAAD